MGDVDYSQFNTLFRQKSSIGKWNSKKYKIEKTPSCFEISPNGRSLAVGNTAGDLMIIHSTENNEFEESDRQQRHTSKITDIAFNPTSDLIATCSNEASINLTSYRSDSSKIGSKCMRLKMNDSVRAVKFVEDYFTRSSLLISAVGRQICITDCSSGTTFKVFSGHTGTVTALFMWGGCMFASSSTDKTVRIWDMRVVEPVRVFDPLPKSAAVGSTTFQVDSSGRLLFRADGSGVIHLFDISTNKKISAKKQLNSSSNYLQISRSKRFLLAADQNSIKLCDYSDVCCIPRPSLVTDIETRIIAARWHPCLPNFITLDEQSGLRFWGLQLDGTNSVNKTSS